MLTRHDIKHSLATGKLFQARPIVPWAGERRAFLMCEPLNTAIQMGSRSADEKERQRWAELEGSIRFFVEGGLINDGLMKQLLPPKYEHWELISRKPKPSMRIFGRFAEPDIFVGTHVQLRKLLGGFGSPEFEYEMLLCEEHWNACGLGDPFTDRPTFRYEAYITENASKKVRIPK